MTQRELQQKGMLYRLDDELLKAHQRALHLTSLLNNTSGTERERRKD